MQEKRRTRDTDKVFVDESEIATNALSNSYRLPLWTEPSFKHQDQKRL